MNVKIPEAAIPRLAEVGIRVQGGNVDVRRIEFPDALIPESDTLAINIDGRTHRFDLNDLDPERDITTGAITDLLDLVAKMHQAPDAQAQPAAAREPEHHRGRRK